MFVFIRKTSFNLINKNLKICIHKNLIENLLLEINKIFKFKSKNNEKEIKSLNKETDIIDLSADDDGILIIIIRK